MLQSNHQSHSNPLLSTTPLNLKSPPALVQPPRPLLANKAFPLLPTPLITNVLSEPSTTSKKHALNPNVSTSKTKPCTRGPLTSLVVMISMSWHGPDPGVAILKSKLKIIHTNKFHRRTNYFCTVLLYNLHKFRISLYKNTNKQTTTILFPQT